VGGVPVDLLGVDPATFTDGVRWREDAAASPLPELVGALAAGSDVGVAALVTGDLEVDAPLVLRTRREVSLDVVDRARWFAGAQAGTDQVVMLVDEFTGAGLQGSAVVWVRDPPPGTLDLLEEAGYPVRSSLAAQDVFEVVSFLAVAWSYDAFAGLGLLVALVTLAAEVVVLQARRRSRQVSYALTRPMGVTGRQHGIAVAVEIAIPILAGALVGVLAAIVAAWTSVDQLDTLRHLDPPAQPHLDVGALWLAAGGVAAALVGQVDAARPVLLRRSA